MGSILPLSAARAEANCWVNGESVDCPPWAGFAGMGFGLAMLAFGLWAFIFWIYMLVHCLRSDMESTEKLVWVLVLLFANLIGALIYYFVIKRSATSRSKNVTTT